MTTYVCARCGTLALPTNSDLVDGQRFVHRTCKPTPGTHSFFCVDDGCRGECQAGLYINPYTPDDVEPMGGDPYWREREL